jgi:hypothetical protein
MSGLQRRANAFGEPRRHDTFGYAADGPGLVGVAGLTAPFPRTHHNNAVRQHLAKLVAAELAVEAKRPSAGPGRPRLPDAPDPAGSRWGVTGPHERLSMWLSEIVRADDKPVVVGRRAGADDPRAGSGPAVPVRLIVDQTARYGFDATVARPGDAAEITYPFASTTVADPATVCARRIVDRPRARPGDRRAGGRRARAYRSRRARRLRCRVESDTPAGTAP